ncbi:unnamed protein product [Amoebophrya sp. A25]|nr:unnamed protein product [Amoebophrya sp. A25]|eukprot:GSA25T00025371001.1
MSRSSRFCRLDVYCFVYGSFVFRFGTSVFTRACQFELLSRNHVALFANSQTWSSLFRIFILQLSGYFIDIVLDVGVGKIASTRRSANSSRSKTSPNEKLEGKGVPGGVPNDILMNTTKPTDHQHSRRFRGLALFLSLDIVLVALFLLVASNPIDLTYVEPILSSYINKDYEDTGAGDAWSLTPFLTRLLAASSSPAAGVVILHLVGTSLGACGNLVLSAVPGELGLSESDMLLLQACDTSVVKITRSISSTALAMLAPWLPFQGVSFWLALALFHATGVVGKLPMMIWFTRSATSGSRSARELDEAPSSGKESSSEEDKSRTHPPHSQAHGAEESHAGETSSTQSSCTSEEDKSRSTERTTTNRDTGEEVLNSLSLSSRVANYLSEKTKFLRPGGLSTEEQRIRRILMLNTMVTNFFLYPVQSVLLPVLFKRVSASMWLQINSLVQLGGTLGPVLSNVVVVYFSAQVEEDTNSSSKATLSSTSTVETEDTKGTPTSTSISSSRTDVTSNTISSGGDDSAGSRRRAASSRDDKKSSCSTSNEDGRGDGTLAGSGRTSAGSSKLVKNVERSMIAQTVLSFGFGLVLLLYDNLPRLGSLGVLPLQKEDPGTPGLREAVFLDYVPVLLMTLHCVLTAVWGCVVACNNAFTVYFGAFLTTSSSEPKGKVLANMMTLWSIGNAAGNYLQGVFVSHQLDDLRSKGRSHLHEKDTKQSLNQIQISQDIGLNVRGEASAHGGLHEESLHQNTNASQHSLGFFLPIFFGCVVAGAVRISLVQALRRETSGTSLGRQKID